MSSAALKGGLKINTLIKEIFKGKKNRSVNKRKEKHNHTRWEGCGIDCPENPYY